MLRDGYPVAEILQVGHHQGSLYYIERALGEDTFGDACADRIAHGGSMTDEEFAGFLSVMRQHAQAQLAGENRSSEPEEFAEFIGVPRAVANTPDLAVTIHAAWGKAAILLSGLPTALQHGDLHPFNVCRGGIIDLESAGWAPVGYDVATAILEPTLAEPRWLDGALGLEWFTPDQVRFYRDVLVEEFDRFDLPAPSTQIHAHLVCRAINLGSRIHRNASVWEARQLMLAQVLTAFLDSGRLPLAFAA
jgi:aminoglycoside phosphotransferase (APT) family kinase protein